jgi:nucleoside-diphosphate-sugar epimerase
MRFPAETVAALRRHYEGRHALVTGGAGFIGGHLVDGLLAAGASVAVIDDLSNSTLDHLAELIELEPDRVRFIHGSILDDDAVADAAEGADAVFHLAAMGSVPRSIEEPQRAWSVNATGTLRVLEGARAAGTRRIVFAASSSAYGDDPSLPKVETQMPRPMSPYAASKLAGEHLMAVWARSYGLSTVSLRYFNIFGPRQPGDSAYAAVIAAFTRRRLAGERPVIYGDGQQSRDFTSVTNAVLATMLAGSSPAPLAGEVLNIGTGRRVTLRELDTLITARVDSGAPEPPVFEPARPGDVRHSLADISRAQEVLGYTPIATLEQGLDETVAWYRQQMAGTG